MAYLNVPFEKIPGAKTRWRTWTSHSSSSRATTARSFEAWLATAIAGTDPSVPRSSRRHQANGLQFATRAGITIAISDLKIPEQRNVYLAEADGRIEEIKKQYQRGLITEDERYNQAVEIWTDTTEKVTKAMSSALDRFSSIYMMSTSGAKGNIQQLRQMAAMRGLMTAPNGRIIDLPIRSSFREGLTVLEYFISTHGARKGLADTAIRTADSGYLTRRLIDVSQDVIVNEVDCGTTTGIWIGRGSERASRRSWRTASSVGSRRATS